MLGWVLRLCHGVWVMFDAMPLHLFVKNVVVCVLLC